jgi:MFS family permease
VSQKDHADRPATFREVLASGEYRALYLASVLSWFGDYVARAAVTALVFRETESVAASAATFAISYLPWFGLGPILAAVAERYSYRSTMIVTDLIRMVLIALVALPGMPVWGMIALLFVTALCNPPFDAARSALLPKILTGDRYVVGLTLQTTSHQVAQIVGYLSGAGLSVIDAHAALLFNAATFGVSAVVIALRIRSRPPALAADNRSHLLRETVDGIRLVFGAPVLRAVALIVFLSTLFSIVPEGLAAAWAHELAPTPADRGWVQGAIMISNPVGYVVGGFVVGRLFGPARRRRSIPFFALAVPASLVPAVIGPPVQGVVVLSFICGVAAAGLIPATNGLFVQALPDGYRARAFGVMKSGIQVVQGFAVFVTGLLAERFELTTVVGVWGMVGVGLVAGAVLIWPDPQRITAEIAKVTAANDAVVDDEIDTDHRISLADEITVELRKPPSRPAPV